MEWKIILVNLKMLKEAMSNLENAFKENRGYWGWSTNSV